ncbi:hypothetical protein ACYFX5_26770 [Bremerella sp. T1]|uniref:hypothetical protein n=1 Tax=Bremerella sp. TYQ1 TaxID=3119568 RepID=UPI001CCF9F47|nr:hypothetical protein [Bremerella volcania]UBM36613.1 hypothetical protein LA756_01625 [Bremerella volcania]
MTTNTVAFSVDDVEILYSIPLPGGDIATIVRAFTFLNRSAPPPFSLIKDCFTKALQSGIMVENDGHFQIVPEWYKRIHGYDASEGNEIESMLAFQDEFVGEELSVVAALQASFTEKAYSAILQGMSE